MNQTVKGIMIFLIGTGLGTAAGFFAGKSLTEKKLHAECDKEIEEMRQYYKEKIGADNITKDYVACPAEEKPEDPKEAESKKIPPKQFVNYKEYFDAAESEHPEEDPTENQEAEEMDEFHRKNKNRKPKIISAEAAGDIPAGVDHKILRFYAYDESLVDPDIGEEIDEPGYLVGDCLDKYDFADSDEKVIFVINYELDTIYEIEKVYASFGEEYD